MSDRRRCGWAEGTFPDYVRYHDEEWGVPVRDDRMQFEFLVLESAQAGLSWATILKRREGYRTAFAGFDPERVSRFRKPRVERLLANPAIIRNRGKVEAAVNNARRFLEVQREFGSFSDYIWGFVGGAPLVNRWRRDEEVPAASEQSVALARDLRARGFRFVGSTILYAHMQATGLVNDHLVSCFRHREVQRR
ncbi:MAG: DNA-3-methyladenine glycosylase I [Acidobacteria bacterium]|nr:DNA-3-methyladenine glycosylase I [Acidobacteriota bacterium]MXW39535.1 DNA-3-methyladenine glycosylase I [Acidobacteriota bacterium]MYA46964.1 DNA-3-methyladenine glycosylase I [Acidobacteriota bacterium]MYB32903.1 DNA-3-methyladenine glycosylase I [Acidobacteriota bacterium]MYH20951.1 DNA-3-methyladenine glycosylase I [Acidobacteriota bacterium]